MKPDQFPDPSAALDKAFEGIRRMPVPDQPSVTELLALLTSDQPIDHHEANTRPVSIPCSSKRRLMMRILVPSAAAVLLLVGGLGLWLLNSPPALALGDVIKAAEKHKLVRYKQTQTTDDKTNGSGQTNSIIYADLKALRFRSESLNKFQDSDDRTKFIEEVLISVQDVPNGRWLMTQTHPGGKVRPPRKDATLLTIGGDGKNQKSFLENLQDFQQKKGVTSGKDKLDGRETVRFRLEEGGNTTLLWVDAKTKLPVRQEYELIDPTPNISRNRWVWTDFEWDPPLPKGFKNLDEFFSTTPPKGYTLDDQTKKGK